MKIEKLEVVGYQGLNFLSLDFDPTITLIAGENATGKTSVKDSIEFALTGVSRRVSLKKNYDQLVRVGSDPKNSKVSVTVDGFTFTRKVKTGKAVHEEVDTPIVLPHLLGSSCFTLLPHAEQSRLLFAVSGVKRDVSVIKSLMKERGIGEQCIEQAVTMLRAGFAAAAKSCKDEQSRARGRWEGITGDRFGEAKAVNWEAKLPDAIDLDGARAAQKEINEALPALREESADNVDNLAMLYAKMKAAANVMPCPKCNTQLRNEGDKLVEASGGLALYEEAKAEHEKANDAAAQCGNAIRELEAELGNLHTQIVMAEDAERETEAKTMGAKSSLEDYNAWKQAAEALAPTGIPLTLLEAGLLPINERLEKTSKTTGWKPIVIGSDLAVTYGGIEYGLCSESEKWRVDAAISECFSLLSNVKLFVLDRMDVLHPADRSPLLNWLIKIAPKHDSIFVMATLKLPPNGLPDTVQRVWLDAGNAKQESEK